MRGNSIMKKEYMSNAKIRQSALLPLRKKQRSRKGCGKYYGKTGKNKCGSDIGLK